ncbi:kinase-like domain-containing protein [Epithele typhae]|uniref:kinase-like domain-containing protein n=1 Tax=Epithele typhae TaxID=378194 RepID=UPI002008CA4A|nr:kinase-like domain-containing protein [Epithele typhae]KAH9910912.1 kinase-like domain-containing protein [Epithele typhae]
MSPAPPPKLPFWALLQDQSDIDSQARLNQSGVYNLSDGEKKWVARQPALYARGYSLRSRYVPGWKPSWIGTNRRALFCEDSIRFIVPNVLDATRREDGQLVVIKTVRRPRELDVVHYIAALKNPRSHCIHVLDVFPDPVEPGITLMVMPYLRPFNDPPMATIEELFVFIDHTLEGLSFLHRHRIAHRDIAPLNVMMDGHALFPEGHHPARIASTPDGVRDAKFVSRSKPGVAVEYLYIDFDCASMFAEGESPMVLGDIGRDAEVPELSETVPYNAFKVDIFALGNLYLKEFVALYKHLEFLDGMINRMKQHDPQARPTVDEVVKMWEKIRTDNQNRSSWRLSLKSETSMSRLIDGIHDVAMSGIGTVLNYIA